MESVHPLAGKCIQRIDIASDRQAIRFVLTDGEVVANVQADCCSYTWIEHVELPAHGFPATVRSVHDLDMPDTNKPSKWQLNPDVLAFYGCKIVTDRGDIVIDYRNDSNGYYGGALAWPGDYAHNRYSSTYDWKPATEG